MNNRTYKKRKLSRIGERAYKTDIMDEDWPKNKKPFCEECVTTPRFVLERGVVGRLADDTIIATLMVNSKNCTIEDGKCSN